ncbi:MAG TPA: YjjG family noncanonical pyrimidine nucleotidase [Flavobacteriaceae bacterium]|nr:YjjG family noncanonical pyrimidine nucleotidase [Flavobacteriaceae bacterium]
MKPANITDIFFDLDHTLWDFEKNSAVAFERIFAKHKIELELQTFLECYIPINNNYWELYQRDEITQEKLRCGRLNDTFCSLQFAISPEKIEELATDYIDHLPHSSHLFPGVLTSLEYLHKKYRLHIITNGFQEVQRRKMASAKIDHYFKTVTTSDEVGVKKPNPKIFAHALEKARVAKANCLMIGDNLEADIRGARDFGIQTLHFSQIGEPHPGLLLHHDELLNLF